MAARRKRWKQVLPTITLTFTPFVWSQSEAKAFFPPVVTPPPVVVPPVVVPPVVVPPVVPPPVIVPPPPCCSTGAPNCVPEPMTIMSTLVGLATVAGYGYTRRKDKNGEAEAGDEAKS